MIAKGFLLLSAAIVLIVGSPVENEVLDIESRQGTVNYRLTDDFIPISYEIELTPYFAQVGSSAIFIILVFYTAN